MDKKKGIINVVVAIFFRILILISSIIVRRFLIKYVGNEANGLDSLFTSIVGFLAVAELGVGSAITFCMYKPIVEGNKEKISALFGLFRRLYLIIGAVILVCGCIVMPFLPYLAKGYSVAAIDLYLPFGLMLVSIVLSYGFSAEISLFNAYKNNYIATSINSSGQLLQYVLQAIVLVVTSSFVWYFVCRIIATAVQWVITSVVSHKKFREIIELKQKVDKETKQEVTKNIKAMFMHKIGGVLVNTADSIIISTFIGVVLLGKYTNYTVIMTAMVGTITLFFSPLTSVIGHMCVEENKETVLKYYNFFYSFNFILGVIFFLGYYAVIDNLVSLFFGDSLEMTRAVAMVITINYFIQFMRQTTLLFRDATGTFYYDRWKPLIEGIVNVLMSIGFVYLFEYLFGAEFAVVGVIVATIITNLFICHIIEPYVLFKHAFAVTVKKYYLRNYACIIIFVALLFALHFSMVSYDNQWLEMLVNGSISIAFSFVVAVLLLIVDKNSRSYFKNFISRFKRKKVSVEPNTTGLNNEIISTEEKEGEE